MQEILNFIIGEIRGTWRFRWLAIGIAWVACVLGWLFVYMMPDVYEARSQVFVDADSRLVDVMSEVGVAPNSPGATVFVVRQAMLARPQLENVAHDTGLDQRAENKEELENLIVGLRETILIEQGRFAESRNLFTISYRDSDPEMAVLVVTKLLDRFVADVLERNDQGSQQATDYLDDQLTYYGSALSEVEKKLADFKKRNLGLLPGDSGGIFDHLQQEMDLLKKLNRDLSIERDRRNALRDQLRAENPALPDGTPVPGTTGTTGSPTGNTIRELEATRGNLLLSYTERHPDVVAVNEQLEQLYENRRAELSAMNAEGAGIEGVANASNPVYQQVQMALNTSSVKIASLESEISQHEALIDELNGQINTIPDIEAEFAQLNRDYDQYRVLYNQLLVQKERERMGKAGENREVVSFNIIEPPAASIDPVAPPRTIFLLFVLAVGLGAGGGVAYLRHLSHPVFSDINDLREFSGRPVLGAVSITWTKEHRAQRMVEATSFLGAGTLLLATFVATVIFQDVGVTAMHWLTSKGG